MLRLSIVIPVMGDHESLERGLVSVLENQPPATEVVLVFNAPYGDPYRLRDEVRFVQAPSGAGWVACANMGFAESRSDAVCLLACGSEVAPDWEGPALAHFDDPRVAAVAPMVLDRLQPWQVLASAIGYAPGGKRLLANRGRAAPSSPAAPQAVLGTTRLGGFYRRSAVTLSGGFDDAVGDDLADVDLALRLRHAGYRAIGEPASVVQATMPESCDRTYRRAIFAERLFWRNVPAAGWLTGLTRHPFVVAGDIGRKLPSCTSVAAAAGRFKALFEVSNYRRHHSRLDQWRFHAALAIAQSSEHSRRPGEPRPEANQAA